MTEKEKKPNIFEEFVAETSKLEDLSLVIKQSKEDSRPEIKDSAIEKIRKTAYHYAREHNLTTLTLDRYVQDGETLSNHLNMYQDRIRENSGSKYSKNNLEGFARGINEKTLDALIMRELNPENERPLIRSAMLKDHKELFEVYQTKLVLEEQVKRFQEGKLANEKEKDMFLQFAAEGYAIDQEKAFKKLYKNETHSKAYLEMVIAESKRAVIRGQITDDKKLRGYAVKGVKSELEDITKKYKEIESKGTVYDAARNAIRKVAESSDPDIVNPLTQTLYSLYKNTK